VVSAARECIGLAHALPRSVLEGEVESREVERPASLSAIEFLRRPEVFEVLVVGENLYRVLRAFEIVSPLLECSDDRKHLQIMNLVIPFDFAQAFGQERDRVPLVILPR
jgi:hypothetical protein